jgi:hypothetical protein
MITLPIRRFVGIFGFFGKIEFYSSLFVLQGTDFGFNEFSIPSQSQGASQLDTLSLSQVLFDDASNLLEKKNRKMIIV